MEGERVVGLKRRGKSFVVRTTAAGYGTKTVLIASGKKPRKLGVPGEEWLYRKGFTYCATCDAPPFAGKDVAVVGGGMLQWTLRFLQRSI